LKLYVSEQYCKEVKKITNEELYYVLQKSISVKPKCTSRWEEIYPNHHFQWDKIFGMIGLIKEMKLSSFQYKIVHRIIACKRYVAKGNKEISELCESCNISDTIEHFFIECPEVNRLWHMIKKWFNQHFQPPFSIENINVIFGSCDRESFLQNYVLLRAKWYIYQSKLEEKHIYFVEFLKQLKHAVKIE
jgi:hypothetical protein